MSDVNRMDDYAKFLLDSGLLFEINRQVLHPLGLALEMTICDETGAVCDETGAVRISGLWDYRMEPEGIYFSDEAFESGLVKWNKFENEFGMQKRQERRRVLGYIVQTGKKDKPEEDGR